jgi:hypothetical protein
MNWPFESTTYDRGRGAPHDLTAHQGRVSGREATRRKVRYRAGSKLTEGPQGRSGCQRAHRGRTGRPSQPRDCGAARGRRYDFAERHLDRIEVGRVFGQIAKRRAARFDRLANSDSLVGREIVDHDDILGSERRGKTPFDIGQEPLSGHGAVNGLRRHAGAARPRK